MPETTLVTAMSLDREVGDSTKMLTRYTENWLKRGGDPARFDVGRWSPGTEPGTKRRLVLARGVNDRGRPWSTIWVQVVLESDDGRKAGGARELHRQWGDIDPVELTDGLRGLKR